MLLKVTYSFWVPAVSKEMCHQFKSSWHIGMHIRIHIPEARMNGRLHAKKIRGNTLNIADNHRLSPTMHTPITKENWLNVTHSIGVQGTTLKSSRETLGRRYMISGSQAAI